MATPGRRKVQIVHDRRRCYWLGDLIALLERDHGFELTGKVASVGILLGWLPVGRLDEVRAMPEVASVSDDYPFLVQDILPS